MVAYLFLVAQLAILTFLTWQYNVEQSLHIPELALATNLGFIGYLFIPVPWKLRYFLLLGWAGMVYFIGITDALLGIGYGLILFAATMFTHHSWLRRGLIVLIIGIPIALLIQRSDWTLTHLNAFSLFGSMTIYRLLIFLYDKKHQKEEPGIVKDLTYFFMLPNMALTLFPAVDYTLWLKNYMNDRVLLIQKKGVQWMALGLFHLILYRMIYFYLVLPLSEVQDLYTFVWHATSTYVLILRLSGIFHLAAGILCLFGFNMPPVFNNYFLATGFSDIWRRLNIYFRDFMVKIFYYPVYFKIRKLGNQRATVLAILAMFIISWMLHSYQWFWFKGTFPLKWVDLIFWNTWGVLVAASVFLPKDLWREKAQESPWFSAGIHMLKMLATFFTMSFLWSLWSVSNLSDWTRVVSQALRSPAHQFFWIAIGGIAIWSVGTLLLRIDKRRPMGAFFNPPSVSGLASFWSLSMLGFLLLLQIPDVHQRLGHTFGIDMNGLLTAKLSAEDTELQIEGYYTDLLYESNLTSPLVNMNAPGGKQFQQTEGAIQQEGFLNFTMRPNTSFLFKDKPFTINSWGFRDREYTLEPPPKTIRSLLMGGSFVAGSGVADNEVVDFLLESRMNQADSINNYEFLNLGCPHYDLLESVWQFEENHLEKFKPRYLFYFSHGRDLHRNNKDILKCFKEGYDLPYLFIKEVIQKSGIQKTMSDLEMMDRLEPYGPEILEKTYDQLRRLCQTNHITPIWVFWPTVDIRGPQIDAKEQVKAIAKKSGFTILDLQGIYEPYTREAMKISEEDIHPSPQNHRLIADTLFHFVQSELLAKPAEQQPAEEK